MKILVCCNTLTEIQSGPYHDHARFYYRLGKDYPKIEFHQFFARRLSIDRFRNTAMRLAIDMKMDYILFIDDDMQLEPIVFKQLYDAARIQKYDVIAALNYIRAYPFDPMAFSFSDKEHNKRLLKLSDEVIDSAAGGVVDCDAIGTAVCLINMAKAKSLPPAWFITGPHNTEDIYFCMHLRKHFPKAKIGVHTGAITGHLLDPEIISYHTRSHLKKYYESYMSNRDIEIANNVDRGQAYVDTLLDEND